MIEDLDERNPHLEPCLSCGEETAAGSVFFSDRHEVTLKDGTRGYVCSACVGRIRSKGAPSESNDMRNVEVSAIVLAQGWF